MSLIQEINRTETEKNKTKQVATNIDNKLVELGGEESIDLSDVPNKMGVMVKENYKKVAYLDYSKNRVKFNLEQGTLEWNLDFKPSKTILHFTSATVDSLDEEFYTIIIPEPVWWNQDEHRILWTGKHYAFNETEISNKKFSWKKKYSTSKCDVYLAYIIAIE